MIRTYRARKWMIKTALSYLGTPYIWGGDDPSGFDCSGFVIECLKSVGLMRELQDMTADSLMRKYDGQRVTSPRRGVLVFHLGSNRRAKHVTIALDRHFAIGASGGGALTTNIDSSWHANAFVKIRPIESDCTNLVFADPFRF